MLLFQKPFSIKSVLSSSNVNLQTSTQKISGAYIFAQDTLILSFSIIELGIITKYEMPVFIRFRYSSFDKSYLKNMKEGKILVQDNQIFIIISSGLVYKIQLIDISALNGICNFAQNK
jgi:hypothetical protein